MSDNPHDNWHDTSNLKRLTVDVAIKLPDVVLDYVHELEQRLLAAVTERRTRPSEAAPQDVAEQVELALEDDPFIDDVHLAGTTQQSMRCKHYARAAIEAIPSDDMAHLIQEARFLCDRIREFDGHEGLTDEAASDLHGHVMPSVARMEMILRSLSTKGAQDA